ncbi:hypothetical protein [Chthonomonas calidirosea]|uniref:hypothetical protein n=1 Tax=Chthonomonas calidirosea TaxID=454171 RepID=UPI0006EC43B1|nr:hypothetical protein [Chthonomonas calidirosea]CEK14475.1 hypothetical protein CP488_00850 [Chthonomonas calidirosea]
MKSARLHAALVGLPFWGPAIVGLLLAAGCGGSSSGGLPGGSTTLAQVTRGQYLVTSLGCTDCHNGGKDDPSDPQWLAGYTSSRPTAQFQIGPFTTYAANITPDTNTGLGNFTDRQIYNALKYGLDPMFTPDVVITSTTPGQGNFPSTPHYLAPPMPWPSFRHLSDDDLWSIVAYIHHGIKAVSNQVPASQGPPDFWASTYNPNAIGPATIPPYPSGNEQFQP